AGCSFCRIIAKEIPFTVLYETDEVVAICDILPLRFGHTLVVPKVHIPHVRDLPVNIAATMGVWPKRSNWGANAAMQNTALNIICNQEYAQSVPHVHFHIIPAPRLGGLPGTDTMRVVPRTTRELHQLEYEGRSELGEDEGRELAEKIWAGL
ncbi:HIT-like protein, partial [Pisolithus marmoratus]